MEIAKLVLSIIDVLAALFLAGMIKLSHVPFKFMIKGMKAILFAGGADTFLSKNKAKSWDAKLAKMTKWVAIGFMVITFIICLI